MGSSLLLTYVLVSCLTSHKTAGFMLDSSRLESSTVRSLAGSPVTLPCPGLGLSPFVVSLSWLCRRCGPSSRRDGPPRTLMLYRDGRAQPAAAAAAAAAAAVRAGSRGGEGYGAGAGADLESESEASRFVLDDTTFALIISRSRASDSGDYFCVVNSRQQPKGAVRLEVRDTPDAPGRPLVLAFSSRTANISWTHPRRTNFSPVIHYLIHVRETERGPWDRSLRTASNHTTYQVVGLRPYTVYSFRLTAVNGVGAGRPGQPSYPVHTLREPPSGLVGDLRAVSRGPTSVQLSWRQAAAGTLHGEFLGYQLTYRSPATGANRSLVITEQNVTSLVVTGLEPFTEYLFSLAIRNPRGLGPAARVTGRTRQSVPGPPASVRYTSVGSTWAVLMWTPPEARNGVLLHYTVNISGDSSELGRPPDLRQVAATEERWLQYRVERLSPFTRYTIGVSAATAAGSGRQRVVQLRTDTAPPGRPVILGVSCVQGGATQVRWHGPADPGPPPLSFFTVGFRNARDAKYQLTRTPAGVGEHTIIMRHLDQGITYFKIQAVRRSRYSQSAVYRGEFSDQWRALLPGRNSDCSEFRLIHPVQDGSSLAVGVGVLAGVVAASVVIAIIVILICRRRSRRGRRPLTAKAARPDWRQEAIPAHLFSGYVRDLQRGADAGFWKELAAVDAAAEEASARTNGTSATNGHHTGANGHHTGTNGCSKPNGTSLSSVPTPVEGYNTTYLLQEDDSSPQFWQIVRKHRVHTIVRFSNEKGQLETGNVSSDWPAPFAGCEVQQKADSAGGLLLLPPPSHAQRLTTAVCGGCCAGGGRQEVRYLQLASDSAGAGVRQYLLRQKADARTSANTHTTVLVVTRGAEQSAALLVAADTLTRQQQATGDLSPVAVLTQLRTVRPRCFADVSQLKLLYQLLSDQLGAAESAD